MLERYREIFYGLLLGIGVEIIDVGMHAHEEGRSYWQELLQTQPATLFYRFLFLSFGLVTGWLLWMRNKRERDFRQLAETFRGFQRDIANPASVVNAQLEVLLTRKDLQLNQATEEIVRSMYERSKQIVSISKQDFGIEK
jgi:hypothetical protein